MCKPQLRFWEMVTPRYLKEETYSTTSPLMDRVGVGGFRFLEITNSLVFLVLSLRSFASSFEIMFRSD